MNRLQLLTWVLIGGLSAGAVSCSSSGSGDTPNSNKETPVTPSNQRMLPERVDFQSAEQSKLVPLGNLGSSWQLSSSEAWCKAVIQGSSIKIDVTENDDTSIREARIELSSSGSTQHSIQVRQLGSAPAILLNRDIFSSLPASGGKIDFEITTNVQVEVKLPDWVTKPAEARAMRKEQHSYLVQPNQGETARTGQIEVVQVGAAEGATPLRKIIALSQDALAAYVAGTTAELPNDEKITIVSGTDTSHQADDSDISKSFDGNYSTLYHSRWSNSAANYYPITLTYNFEQVNQVDYFVYYPRQTQSNGRFHRFDVEYSQDGTTYTKVDSYTFDNKAQPTRITFDRPIQAKHIRFVVNKGYGDGKGFASCAEMEFYKKSDKGFDYKTIFADDLCTTVRPEVTDAQIQAITDPFFRNLAYYIKSGKYNTEFRVASFKPYEKPTIVSSRNKTNPYSLLDNPTGISVSEGQDLIVFVGDTHGFNELSIRVQNLDKPGGDGFGDAVYYALYKGFNKIRMTKPGLVYVMYHVNEGQDQTMQPIDIHFASGNVNGYYDSQNPKLSERWRELLGKANYKYFDVLGKYAHLTFETQAFRSYTDEGREIAKTYDSIVHNEWVLHGLYKYNRLPKNRMYLHVMYHQFMYATWHHTAYVSGTQKDILDPHKMRNPKSQGAAWGPSHEIGHMNQTRPGLLWRGMTEVTVNIPSEYITTYVFQQPSRLQSERLGEYFGNNRYTKAFTNVIAKGVPFCDAGDVFCNLVPFWQLELYFGKVLGRTPRQSADGYSGFYPDLYQYLRVNPDLRGAGNQQTEFPFVASKIGERDLTRYFERWGFFREVDKEINDYSREQLTVTAQRVAEVKERIKALNHSNVDDLALEYITDGNAMLFKNRPEIVAGSHATTEGAKVTIAGWQNVVAFEVLNAEDRLIFIADASYPALGNAVFTMPFAWERTYKIRAVSAGNKRVDVPVN